MSAKDAIGRSSSERLHDDAGPERQPFLTTYRAGAACTREFGRLIDEVLDGMKALPLAGISEKAVARQSPDRCVVQLGPVALTLGWLQNTRDSVAMGELLVSVWEGAITRRAYQPERASAANTAPAMELWTEVFAAKAADEASWLWHSKSGEESYSSTDLAARCVDRLRVAFVKSNETA